MSETVPSNEWAAFPKEKARTFQRNGVTCQMRDNRFFETGVTLFSFNEEMVTPSNIDKNWVLKRVLLL